MPHKHRIVALVACLECLSVPWLQLSLDDCDANKTLVMATGTHNCSQEMEKHSAVVGATRPDKAFIGITLLHALNCVSQELLAEVVGGIFGDSRSRPTRI